LVVASPIAPAAEKSILRRALGFFSIAIFFTTLGVAVYLPSMVQTSKELAQGPPTDEETLTMYTPADDFEREIEDFIRNHPVAVELRSRPEMSESRPHMKIPQAFKAHNLTGGTLMGPGKVAVPPFAWNEAGGKSMVSISYLGNDLCGHPGIIHGGMLATMLDEGLARCCFAALPNKIGMTANLNINYKAPAPAGAFVVLRAETTKVEGRKAWVKGHIETLVGEGEKPVVLVEATALFIEPKLASVSVILLSIRELKLTK
jgi:3'-phosphoadenosine 5'-phosphosulfate synthase